MGAKYIHDEDKFRVRVKINLLKGVQRSVRCTVKKVRLGHFIVQIVIALWGVIFASQSLALSRHG